MGTVGTKVQVLAPQNIIEIMRSGLFQQQRLGKPLGIRLQLGGLVAELSQTNG